MKKLSPKGATFYRGPVGHSPGAAVMLSFVLLADSGWAASPTGELRGFFEAVVRILDEVPADDSPDARLHAVRARVGGIFDVGEAARLSLGPDWETLTPAERDEFVRLFADLLERSFIAAVASRIRLADGVKVTYLGESIDGDTATVRTTVTSRNALELAFDYRMVERGERWMVRDVVIDGVSLAANYRAQFSRIIQSASYAELVQMMRAKVGGTPAEVARVEPSRPVPPPSTDDARAELATVVEPEPSVPAAPEESAAIATAPAAIEPISIAPAGASEQRPASPEPARPALAREPDAGDQRPAAGRPPDTPAATATTYWVQLGAFSNSELARRLASQLQQQAARLGRWTVTMAPGPAGSSLVRVRVGPFPDRAEAGSTLREFQARGYRPFIAQQPD
ncbi:MAG TPA: ABC transporter substrate-binding protein [Methylomirabilota bacterium]|nr:ABC transporter substrate-binding protein [Methylomirabilota bacterium]